MYANVTGTPFSCICATSPSVFLARAPSKPGKPQLPWLSVMFEPSVAFTHGLPPVIAGLTYFAPNSAMAPLFEPGTIVASSGFAFGVLQTVLPVAQWMAMPTKSASASVGFVLASVHSGEPAPKTRVMSPDGAVDVFSSSMFAADTPPTLQPAAVYVSHGAGVVCAPSETMFGSESSVPSTVSVQYLKEDVNVGTPFAL